MSYFKDFRAVSLVKDRKNFPIRVKPKDYAEEEKLETVKAATVNPINTKLVELVKMMHGSFESKQKIIDDFNARFPECSKKSIEKKMRELFEKDKKDTDPK